MDKNTTTKLTSEVPDYGAQTQAFPQHGMRYPDGRIQWVSTRTPNYSATVYFDKLAAGDEGTQDDWNRIVRQRAASANIDPAEYAAGHQLVKRTVILAVTEMETA